MARHRFLELIERPVEVEQRLVGGSRSAVVSPTGFMVCPVVVQQWLSSRACQWDVYERAWQQALDLARPSILERCQAFFWN